MHFRCARSTNRDSRHSKSLYVYRTPTQSAVEIWRFLMIFWWFLMISDDFAQDSESNDTLRNMSLLNIIYFRGEGDCIPLALPLQYTNAISFPNSEAIKMDPAWRFSMILPKNQIDPACGFTCNPESFTMRGFTKMHPVCGFTDFYDFLMIFDDFPTISMNNLRVYP